jgi:hypothetical protein
VLCSKNLKNLPLHIFSKKQDKKKPRIWNPITFTL